MSETQYDIDARRALGIARKHRLHKGAIQEIIAVNLAEDAADADELIREGERLGPAPPKAMPPGTRNIFGAF